MDRGVLRVVEEVLGRNGGWRGDGGDGIVDWEPKKAQPQTQKVSDLGRVPQSRLCRL